MRKKRFDAGDAILFIDSASQTMVASPAKKAARNALEASQIVGTAKVAETLRTSRVADRITVEASHEPEQLNEIVQFEEASHEPEQLNKILEFWKHLMNQSS